MTDDNPNLTDSITKLYAENQRHLEERRKADDARGFVPIDHIEKALALKAASPDDYERLYGNTIEPIVHNLYAQKRAAANTAKE